MLVPAQTTVRSVGAAVTARGTGVRHRSRRSRLGGLPDETRRDETRRDETRRDETSTDETGRDETGRDETRRDETRRDETRRDETRRDETRRRDDETRPDETRRDETRRDETRRDETRRDETRRDDETTRRDETRRDDETRRAQTRRDERRSETRRPRFDASGICTFSSEQAAGLLRENAHQGDEGLRSPPVPRAVTAAPRLRTGHRAGTSSHTRPDVRARRERGLFEHGTGG
jgi:hypothetical protein